MATGTASVVETIGRFPLSVILSFLSERDGVAFLITNRRFCRSVLPMYRSTTSADQLSVVTGAAMQKPRNYRFAVVPVQDAAVLLERLNTARLFRRRTPVHPHPGLTTEAFAHREWKEIAQHPANLELLRFVSASTEVDRHYTEQPSLSSSSGKTLLVSYPRSGNSLARHLLERTTGIVTGSDTNPTRLLSQQLAMPPHNLVGEGLVHSSQVAIVKSHWPERKGWHPVTARRVILLVRNPFDAMDSYWNLNATLSHTARLTDAMYTRFATKFGGLVRNEITMWHKFLEYWLVANTTTSVCVVRYEDLVRDPVGQVSRMLQCVLDESELSTFWHQRVQHAVASMPQRRPPSPFGKSLGRYSPELLAAIHQVERADPHQFMSRFGYSIVEQGFPTNFANNGDQNPPYRTPWSPSRSNIIKLNVGESIRPADCLYGRALRDWRHSVTKNDTEPLPTIQRQAPTKEDEKS